MKSPARPDARRRVPFPPPPVTVLVTDRRRGGSPDPAALHALADLAMGAARAGVTFVQVREPDLDDRRLLDLVLRIRDAVSGTDTRVLVNERTDVALAAHAHGVHLRGASVSAARVRRIVPAGFLIGRAVHDVEEAVSVEQEGGCDYLQFGTVFPSAGKPPGHPVAGVEALRQVCSSVALPVIAIGGITPERAGEAARAGAAGVAAIGLFADAPPRQDRITAAAAPALTLADVLDALRRAFDSGSRVV
jgi:thiamine-phosphate diphosphorylase